MKKKTTLISGLLLAIGMAVIVFKGLVPTVEQVSERDVSSSAVVDDSEPTAIPEVIEAVAIASTPIVTDEGGIAQHEASSSVLPRAEPPTLRRLLTAMICAAIYPVWAAADSALLTAAASTTVSSE